MSHARAALAAGAAVFALVAVTTLSAWRSDSAIAASAGGAPGGSRASWLLVALALAVIAYAGGLALLRRTPARLAAVTAIAVCVQVVPLASPLLLSTDAWTYWAYGWTAAEAGESPYSVAPYGVAGNPALPWMGSAWRDTTSVYGPAFTLASEPLATVARGSADVAAWQYKTLAALGATAAAVLAGCVARRRALAVAFVGWNPVLALHLAGGGHNDAWLAALAVGALALGAANRPRLAGGVWSLAVLVKWVPVVFLGLHLLDPATRRRRALLAGFAVTGAVVTGMATVRYGLSWLTAVAPLAENAGRETSYAVPSRLDQAGLPHAVTLIVAAVALGAGLAWLAREARRGRGRLGLAGCLVLVASPYLAVWYLAWPVALAGADEDRAGRIAALALTAYLAPQALLG